jgi:hypothetical protein
VLLRNQYVPSGEDVQPNFQALLHGHARMPDTGMTCAIGVQVLPKHRVTNQGLERHTAYVRIVLTVNKLTPTSGKATFVVWELGSTALALGGVGICARKIHEERRDAWVSHALEPVEVRPEMVADAILDDLNILEMR